MGLSCDGETLPKGGGTWIGTPCLASSGKLLANFSWEFPSPAYSLDLQSSIGSSHSSQCFIRRETQLSQTSCSVLCPPCPAFAPFMLRKCWLLAWLESKFAFGISVCVLSPRILLDRRPPQGSVCRYLNGLDPVNQATCANLIVSIVYFNLPSLGWSGTIGTVSRTWQFVSCSSDIALPNQDRHRHPDSITLWLRISPVWTRWSQETQTVYNSMVTACLDQTMLEKQARAMERLTDEFFAGHFIPGLFFMLWGLHWMQAIFRRHIQSQSSGQIFSSKPWFSMAGLSFGLPVVSTILYGFEPFLKMLSGPIGLSVELYFDDKNGFRCICWDPFKSNNTNPNLMVCKHCALDKESVTSSSSQRIIVNNQFVIWSTS